MLNHHRIKPWGIFFSFFIFLSTLFFYGFVRDGTWIVIAVLLIPLYRRIGLPNFFLFSISFFLATIISIFIISYGFPQLTYWPPWEKLKSINENGLNIYKPNQSLRVQLPYGQLKPWSKKEEVFDLRPRKVFVQTDSLGFRNDSNYNGEKFILVGDSMIAGAGTSQESILSAYLKNEFNVNVYNLAVPGANIPDYVNYIKQFKSLHGTSFKTLMFLTELNDFACTTKSNDFLGASKVTTSKTDFKKIKKLYKEPIRRYKNLFKQNQLYRFTFSVYRILKEGSVEGGENLLFIGDIGTHRTAFFAHDNTKNNCFLSKEIIKNVESIKEQIDYMIFVPKKYRIYFDEIKNKPHSSINNVEWLALKRLGKNMGIPTINFTDLMIEESKKLLEGKNELLFWEDDSHWNGNGSRVTARLLCSNISELGCSASSIN
jgi:hypothetical protein